MKYIAKNEFLGFVKECRNEKIGQDKKGKATTCKEEFISLYKLCAAYVDAVNAFTFAYEKGNVDADKAVMLSNCCDRTLEKSVKKLCFLNSIAANKYDRQFLTKLIDRGSRKSCNIAIMELFQIVNDALDENAYAEERTSSIKVG